MIKPDVRDLSGKYPAILNISRTDCVAKIQLGSQLEETLLCIREQSLSRGASQSAVRRRWLNSYTVWPSHSQISPLSTAILALEKARSCREPIWAVGVLTNLDDVMSYQKCLHESCRIGRRIFVMKQIFSLGALWMRQSHNTQSQSTASHCRLTSPMGQWLFMDGQ